ncbi:MAG TPA: nucleoside 2-deoxyribosyltransferase [Anaerolineaceae bacterium]|nr:nucleoside 2-deoxyribosyltransferase [Anaerolineaceae bacterium]
MQAYFSCSITGGRTEQHIYQQIVDHLIERKWRVPTAHLAESGVPDEEGMIDPRVVYERDVRWVLESDLLIAEVSTPSHGVGYEIALAEMNKKPVFCCYRKGKKVSKMILGNENPIFCVYAYEGIDDLLKVLDEFLDDYV